MKTFAAVTLAPVFALVLATPVVAKTKPVRANYITTALASPTRPAADKARDAARKPAQLIAFAGIRPGQTVVDFIMGGGYLTRILAGAVGRSGKVIAYQPAEFIEFRAAYGTEQDAVVKDYGNVTALSLPLTQLAFAEQPDVIVTVQNWHDLYLNVAATDGAERVAATLFDALKPGGTLVVVDHAAVAGAPRSVADTLHRVDPAKARADIEKAGFVFDGESKLWANARDPMTELVFKPTLRGKTNQFAYRFRKPR